MGNARDHILFVDDDPNVHSGITRLLRNEREFWQLHFASSVTEALEVCGQAPINLIVSDFNMPGQSGLDLIEAVRNIPQIADLPIVILTGNAEADLKRRALECGAVDLLSKPINKEDLVARLRSLLKLRHYQLELERQNAYLEERVLARTKELESSRNELLWRLAAAVEARDNDTGGHINRVARFTMILARQLGMPEQLVEQLYLASPLHDIGKIAIPDSILRKPGKLTDEERAEMQTHCQIGYDVLMDPLEFAGFDYLPNPMLEIAAVIALTHHEKWDGTGYPNGLAGEQIPISGRIVAVADVLDALCSARSYKEAMAFDEAFAIIEEMSGSHFDTTLVEAARVCKDELRVVSVSRDDLRSSTTPEWRRTA